MRSTAGLKPIAKAAEATTVPTTANDADKPAASATGPQGWRESEPNRTIGSSGRTQGETVDNAPAR